MVNHFPPIKKYQTLRGADNNPAVQLFGRRFFADQTVSELLVELLLVATSNKRIGNQDIDRLFPNIDVLREWPTNVYLEYMAKAKLNLKLFAFLGASKLDTRHATHRMHYNKLLFDLKDSQRMVISGAANQVEVLQTLENLFLGFQGIGGQRTWCAQSFIPISHNLIAGESIWKVSKAIANKIENWRTSLKNFSHNQQIFLARGGELLYLQICNALRKNPHEIDVWYKNIGIGLTKKERTPAELHSAIEKAFGNILNAAPETLDKLAEFIDTGVDSETAARTDFNEKGEKRFTNCGWCPSESWPEGYLFAVEILRLSDADIDPIDRIELLETACALQVLRSLCAQSARYVEHPLQDGMKSSAFKFFWILSDPIGENSVLKKISGRSVYAVQRLIHDAIRHPEIQNIIVQQQKESEARGIKWTDPFKEADTRYGYKLFIKIAKRIGLVIPRRGAGARFVLNDKLLRCMVLSLIHPGERVTYETFKHLLLSHYGLVVDEKKIGDACAWSGDQRLSTIGENPDGWLMEMLDAAGMLIRLSDSFSLVINPFGSEGENL